MRVRASFVLALLLCSAAWAAPVLDQSQIIWNSSVPLGDGNILGQTFTAGLSGKLTGVELGMNTISAAVPISGYPFTVEVRTTASHLPTDTILASVLMPDGCSSGWNSIDFSSQNVHLVAGTKYAIVVWDDDVPSAEGYSNRLRCNTDGNSYPGGQRVLSTPFGWYPTASDIQFRTYVDTAYAIPAPSALALAGIGSVLATRLRKRRTS